MHRAVHPFLVGFQEEVVALRFFRSTGVQTFRSVVVSSAASLRSADNTPQLREHASTRLRRQQGRSDLPL